MKLNGEILVRHKLHSEKAIRDLIHEELREDKRFNHVYIYDNDYKYNHYIDDAIEDNPHQIAQPVLAGCIFTPYSVVSLLQHHKDPKLDIRKISSCRKPDRVDFMLFGYHFVLFNPIINDIDTPCGLENEIEDLVKTLWELLTEHFEKNAEHM